MLYKITGKANGNYKKHFWDIPLFTLNILTFKNFYVADIENAKQI